VVAPFVRAAMERAEPVSDTLFDRLFPEEARALSAEHWTPVAVAARAVRLLTARRATRILDVGAGSGKLCLIGALTTEARWFGIEEQAPLVGAAITAARLLDVSTRTAFLHGEVMAIDWNAFDALYFFNPFASHLEWGAGDPVSRWSRFGELVHAAQMRLERVRPGTRVVTYHGLGGEMPSGYDLISHEIIGTGALDVWVRRASSTNT